MPRHGVSARAGKDWLKLTELEISLTKLKIDIDRARAAELMAKAKIILLEVDEKVKLLEGEKEVNK